MLTAGDRVPDFEVTTVDHRSIRYESLWQRRNLLLVSIPAHDPDSPAYISDLAGHIDELTAHETVCVVTGDAIAGVPRPGVVAADRWGEIHFVAGPASVRDLPPAAELLEWLRFIQVQCPECQGEAR